jgi:hypothetical protein
MKISRRLLAAGLPLLILAVSVGLIRLDRQAELRIAGGSEKRSPFITADAALGLALQEIPLAAPSAPGSHDPAQSFAEVPAWLPRDWSGEPIRIDQADKMPDGTRAGRLLVPGSALTADTLGQLAANFQLLGLQPNGDPGVFVSARPARSARLQQTAEGLALLYKEGRAEIAAGDLGFSGDELKAEACRTPAQTVQDAPVN